MKYRNAIDNEKSAGFYFAFIVGFAVLIALWLSHLIDKGQQDVLRTITRISQSTIPVSLQSIKNIKYMEDLMVFAETAITTENEIKEKEAIGSINLTVYISRLDEFSPTDEYIREIYKLIGKKREIEKEDLKTSWFHLKNRVKSHVTITSASAFENIDADLKKTSVIVESMRHQISMFTFAIMVLSLLVMIAIYMVFIRPLSSIEKIAIKGSQSYTRFDYFINSFVVSHIREMTALSGAIMNLHATTLENTKIRKDLEHQMREASLAAEEKSDFLASMSHEIRTPLSSIAGMLFLLEKSNLSESQAKFTSLLARSCTHLNQIVTRALDVSKLNAYKLDLIPEEIRIDQLLEDAVEMIKPALKTRHIELGVDIDEAVPVVVVGDPVRLKEILINYLNNAVKFTHSGRIDVIVRCLALDQKTATIKMSVKDTGVGIAAEDISLLFTRFSQFGKRRFAGSGLGLAITQGLAHLMGGSVGVETKEGEGSTFWAIVVLDRPSGQTLAGGREPVRAEALKIASPTTEPQAPDPGDAYPATRPAERPETDADAGDRVGRILAEVLLAARLDSPKAPQLWMEHETEVSNADRINATLIGDLLCAYQLPKACAALTAAGVVCPPVEAVEGAMQPCTLIIDDTPNNLEFIGFLIQESTPVRVAVSPLHGLEIVMSGVPIRLIVLDISMPGMDGLEVLKQIKSNPVSADIPVVMISAYSDQQIEERCVLLGASEYVDRGASPDALKKVMMKYLTDTGA